MHAEIEEPHGHDNLQQTAKAMLSAIVTQIILLDLVFSIDSIITAIGMAQHVEVMITAVVIAVGIMYLASGPVAGFIARHPTTKMLALAFLLLIGVTLVADGLGFHIDKGYIYAAMGFAVAVEAINIWSHQRKVGRGRPATMAMAVLAPVPEASQAAKPRSKSTPAARAKSRPKSAPRQKAK